MGDGAMVFKSTSNTLAGYPGFPRPVVARNPWRQGGSHYGEGARGDRREGDGGKTATSGETAKGTHNGLGTRYLTQYQTLLNTIL
jgi:hypothetical protein